MLGEEQWIAERPMDLAMVAARQRHAMPTAAATALEMRLMMAYWELMARYHERNVGMGR